MARSENLREGSSDQNGESLIVISKATLDFFIRYEFVLE